MVLKRSASLDTVHPSGQAQGCDKLDPSEDHYVPVNNILKYLRMTKDVFLIYGDRDLIVRCYLLI